MSSTRPRVLLHALVAETEGAVLVRGDPATLICGVTQDTRRLQPGDLFVAVPGLQQDGSKFIDEAIAGGAAAIVSPHLSLRDAAWAASAPLVVVPDARCALADLSCAFYGHP
jgi:UDP-N-acetylmuramoyl-L-alanyl-D-glutamate--2,6-diaminopimelate ligase